MNSILQGGRESALAEDQLFSRYIYFINEGRKKYGLSEESAFDAYSDSVLSLLASIRKRRFESRSSVKTYLFRIFQNKCVDVIRRDSTNKQQVNHSSELGEWLHQVSDKARTALERLISRSEVEQLRQRLQELSENCRKMLLLNADGYADSDIAAMLGYHTAAVVKTSRLRCLEKLREMYSTKS